MVIFDQLRIADDGNRLYINLHVINASNFEDVYLNKLTIMKAEDTLDAYQESGSSPAAYTSDYIYQETFESNIKEAALVLTPTDFNENFTANTLSSNLFLVYVECTGTPTETTPCELDGTTVAAVFDEKVLYQKVMNFTKEMLTNCQVTQGFTDFILLWNAFKAAVETEHFIPAINYYNMLFNNVGNITTKTCGCNG